MRNICLSLLILLSGLQPIHSTNLYATPNRFVDWPHIKLSSCINVSAVELEKLTGKKFTVIQKLAYSLLRNKMKKAMRKDPGITLDQFMQQKKKNQAVGAGLLIFAVFGLIMIMILLVFYRFFD